MIYALKKSRESSSRTVLKYNQNKWNRLSVVTDQTRIFGWFPINDSFQVKNIYNN